MKTQTQRPIKRKEIPWGANKNSKKEQARRLKRGKTQATKSWMMLVLHLIGWESGAFFLDQSQSKVKQTKEILDYFRL